MAENGSELRKIAWTQAFPFVRLFRSLPLALNFNRLVLALACVLVSYVAGRVLDRIWPQKHGVAGTVERSGAAKVVHDEIEFYSERGDAEYKSWLQTLREAPGRTEWFLGRPAPKGVTAGQEPQTRGIYISMLEFETRCFAAAIQGVCAGRWGISGNELDPQPTMLSSIGRAIRGGFWVVTQRPWFTLVCGVVNLLIFAFFGGALCRSAAVQSARDESISLRESLCFGCQKFKEFVLAPALPLLILAVMAVIMFVAGLIAGAIPVVGELIAGVLYPLGLLGGFAAALILLALVLGFHLMWPTIAAEGSDGFDALSRAGNYVISRIWHVGFYSAVLLFYGALSYVLVRLVAVLTMKLSYSFVGWGMNIFHSAKAADVHKLDVMWQMPAWTDLPLLPMAGVRWWGTFFNAPMRWSEWLFTWPMAFWAYILVGLVGAFVVSFFFCGSTQMYFLLRREVDATDFEEVYYEEPEEEPTPAPEPTPGPAPAEPTPTAATTTPTTEAPTPPPPPAETPPSAPPASPPPMEPPPA